jgi:hypothetical protein
MAVVFEPPVRVRSGSVFWFRHKGRTDSLLCFLKGVKVVSTLNGALLLLRHGYAQEVNALCRIADDLANEILFVMEQTVDGKPSKDQELFVTDFFQEEFANVDDLLGSRQKRTNIPRRKIHAAFGRIGKENLNPSDAQETVETIHQVLSGYVHGAYPQIMELYWGMPPQFHMTGMAGTPREAEATHQMITYVYRAIMVCELIARKLGVEIIRASIRDLLTEFESKLHCKPMDDAEALVRKQKNKKST